MSEGRSVEDEGDKPRRKRGKHRPKPTKPDVNRRQKIKEVYAKAREDAQLADIIPTTPDGAVRPEAVAPETQADAPQCGLIELAIRRGWAVPEERKPGLVDELISIIDNPELPAKVKVAAFNALRQADQAQYERDNPELASKAKGGNNATVVGVTVQTNIDAAAAIREMIERGELGVIEAEQAPNKSSAFSGGRQQRSVEVDASLEGDQQCASEGLEDTE